MTILHVPQDEVVMGPHDELFRLQLRVARRADALAGGATRDPEHDLLVWLEAERDVFRAASLPRHRWGKCDEPVKADLALARI